MPRRIFSVLGILPEPGGYAIAKFSRTPTYKSYQDWVMELTEEGAEKFYNSFYFQYGHASIADLAHLMVIFENISIPARNVLLDDQLIDLQSRSTRYVDYSKAKLIVPPEIKNDKKLLEIFSKTCADLLFLYSFVVHKMVDLYTQKYSCDKPEKMAPDDFQRIVKARAIDIARYLLPCAVPKSMGVIASARTWERITSKFLSADLQEFRQIGKEMQRAICKKQAFNPNLIKIDQASFLSKSQKEKLKKLVAGRNIGLPTLVKFAGEKSYPKSVYQRLRKPLKELKLDAEPDGKRGICFFENIDPQLDLATTLLYRISPYSYKQLLKAIKAKGPSFIKKVIDIFYKQRGEYDVVSREAATGNLIFDICMDIGAFRDLHRHRNCIHILKDLSSVYGFDLPEEVKKIGLEKEYLKSMEQVKNAYRTIENKYPGCGQYILPQAFRRRFLMKMTPWELQYIVELRTRPQGHFSYREIPYKMYLEFKKHHPELARHFRVVNPKVINFFKR